MVFSCDWIELVTDVFKFSVDWVNAVIGEVGGDTSWCVTEQLLEARWSIIFVVGSGNTVFSIPFLVQNSAWVAWKVLLAMAAYMSDRSQIVGSGFWPGVRAPSWVVTWMV